MITTALENAGLSGRKDTEEKSHSRLLQSLKLSTLALGVGAGGG